MDGCPGIHHVDDGHFLDVVKDLNIITVMESWDEVIKKKKEWGW